MLELRYFLMRHSAFSTVSLLAVFIPGRISFIYPTQAGTKSLVFARAQGLTSQLLWWDNKTKITKINNVFKKFSLNLDSAVTGAGQLSKGECPGTQSQLLDWLALGFIEPSHEDPVIYGPANAWAQPDKVTAFFLIPALWEATGNHLISGQSSRFPGQS